MESESIVDYLKSSLGKPWPLIANLGPNLAKNTTATNSQQQPTSVPSLKSQNNITPATTQDQSIITENDTISKVTTNGKDHTQTEGTSPPSIIQTTIPPPPQPSINSPPQPQRLPLSQSSPMLATEDSNNQLGKNNTSGYNNNIRSSSSLHRFNSNHSATQLDGLYPEWDEFYLLVCDICGIIIRPQALEKHLATKHRINVQQPQQQQQPQQLQQQNHKQSLPINRKTSTTPSTTTAITNNDDINHSSSSSASTSTSSKLLDGSTIRTNDCSDSISREPKASLNSTSSSLSSAATKTVPKLPPTTNSSSSSSSSTNLNLSNSIKCIANSTNKRTHVPTNLNNSSDNNRRNNNNNSNVKTVVGTINNTPNNNNSKQTYTNVRQNNFTNTNNHINFVKPTQNGTTTSTTTTATSSTASTTTAQQIPSKLWGGKHALDSKPKPAIKRRPCDWMKVRRAPDANLETLSSFLTKAGPIVDVNSIGQTTNAAGLLHYEDELNGHASLSPFSTATIFPPTIPLLDDNRSSKSINSSSRKTKAPNQINNNCNKISSNNHSQSLSTNGFFDPTFYGLEPLSPTTTTSSSSSSSSSLAPSSSSSLSSTASTSPSRATSLRYQDRKWRTTFNVLKDAFF